MLVPDALFDHFRQISSHVEIIGSLVQRSPVSESDVRVGSIASVWPDHGDFRSTPVNGHSQDRRGCLKGANKRRQHDRLIDHCLSDNRFATWEYLFDKE